jgi:hypothetical protein
LHDVVVPALSGRLLGVVEDRRRGQLIACVRVEGGSFALAPTAEQEQRVNRWGALVANIARSNRHVRRVGFISRTIPSDTNPQLDYFAEAGDPAVTDIVRQSYLELLQRYERTADQREVLFFLTTDRPPHPKRLPEALAHLGDDVAHVSTMFARARMKVTDVLDRVDLALAIRAGFDPWGRAARLEYARRVRSDAAERVGDLVELAPSSVSDRWREVQADRGLHRTAWVSQWPTTEVGALFLLPLIVNPHVVRTIAWVAELRDPAAALRDINHQAIDAQSDQLAMARLGQRPTISRRQKWLGVAAREQELGRGHGEVRHAAYVTTSVFGDDLRALDRAWATTEQDAAQSGVRLEVLARRQAQALTHTLPLGRGIR